LQGRGERSITDVENFVLKLPDFEYHSQLWSWLEFTLQLRRDAIRVLLSNAGALFKDKLRRFGQANAPEGEALARTASRISKHTSEDYENEDRKAKMLLGKSYRK
jgi:hypothetical protein